MKALLRLLLPLIISATPAWAQDAWHFEWANGRPVKLVWQTEAGKTYNLRQSEALSSWVQVPGFPVVATGTRMEYSFVPAQRGFFEIRLVAEGGGGWQMAGLPALPAAAYYDFSAVSALNTDQVWVSGSIKPESDVCVLRSVDGGLTWVLPYRQGGVGFFGDLQMVTPELGYAAGGGLRRTSDGGATWVTDQGNLPNPPGTWHAVGPDGYVYGLAVVDESQVWTAGYDGAIAGVIYHRVPGRPQPDPANPNGNTPWWLEWAATYRGMYGISAVSPTTAWAVGFAGFIWKTTDGQSWGQQVSNTGVALQDVDAVDANTAWAVGDAGTILRTSDGGTTWVAQGSGTTANLRRIAAANASRAWAVGTGGTILHTTDGGLTWMPQFSGTTANLNGVAAVNADTAWVVGDANTLLRTTDGGTGSWSAPVITNVSPAVVGAYSQPSMTVTISGSGFRGGNLRVNFGSTAAETVTWLDSTTIQAVAPGGISGTYFLTVINEDGQQATRERAVTFLPGPLVTHYAPWHALAAGGYQVTIDGYNLQSVNRATFSLPGGQESCPVTVVDSTRVMVTVPASATRAAGTASILIGTQQNQEVTAGDFLFDPAGGPLFAVTSMAPVAAPEFTIFTVTVDGTGFTSDTTLELCERAVNITSRSPTQLVGQAFGNTPGLCRLVATNSTGDYLVINPAMLLTRAPVPTISQVSGTAGPAVGGSSVTITGTGFQPTDTVTFDGYEATITARTSTALTVVTPPHAPGTVSVFVMTENLARSAAVLPGAFTYQ
jgi:photosystem II stability/assembly factor-like uncharacterized protein